MNRSNKSKIAVTLLGALAFGANAQAQDLNNNKITKTDSFSIKSTRPAQNSGKLGQVTIGKTRQIDWKTGGLIAVVSLLGLETVHSIVGATTDSKLGNYSIGRAIKNHVKKNNSPDPDNPDKKEKKKEVDENTKIIEKLSNKFNVIKDEEGNLDKQKIDLLKKALVEILKLENSDEILNKFDLRFKKKFNDDVGIKFIDYVKLIINCLKNDNIAVKFNGLTKINFDDSNYAFHVLFKENGSVLFVYAGKIFFKFSGDQLQLEVFPGQNAN